MYLTSSRPDIMFAICGCARYQVNPKVSHFHAVKRIFRYLKVQPKLGLWYPKDSPFDLVAYTDSDYARASLDRKSTTGVNAARHNLLLLLKVNAARHNLLLLLKVNAARHKLTTAVESENCQWGSTVTSPSGWEKIIVTKASVRRDLQLNDEEYNVANEAVYEEMDDSLERGVIIATSLDAEQDRGNINKTQSKATLNEPSSLGTSPCSSPRRQETIGDTIAQTGFKNVSKTLIDSLLARVNTPRSDEDRLKIKELMELCTNLQNRVIDLEKTKTSQAQEITSLKRRVKRLEKKGGSRTHGLKRLYKFGLSRRVESSNEEGLGEEDASKQGWIADIDADAGINLVSTHFDDDIDMFGVHDLVGDEVVVETEVASKDVNLSVNEVTLAQALATLKSAKPKADKVMLQEPEQGTITTTIVATTVTIASTRPKAKGLVIHEHEQAPTPTVSLQQPSQLNVQIKLQAEEEEEEERLAKKKLNKLKKATLFHGIMCKQ
ncbi:hypothetical protein Tco_1524477 [Tanacetum coccineum]